MGVFGVLCVRVDFEVGVHVVWDFPRVWGLNVYGQVQVPINTYVPVV
jgi:hypothetical protein